MMKRKGYKGKKEKDSKRSKKLYEGENHSKAQEEMKNFSEKAWEIQKKKDNSEDTPQLVWKLVNFKNKKAVKRMELFEKLKKSFEDNCKKVKISKDGEQSISLPKNAVIIGFFQFLKVERWCLTEKLLEDEGDPLIPNPKNDINSALFHELIRNKCPESDAKKICTELAKESRNYFEILKNFDKNENKNQEIKIKKDSPKYSVGYDQKSFKLNIEHFEKLKKLYHENNKKDEKFYTRLFCLLARYETLGASSYQASIPDNLFKVCENY
jgi:hypothetical protein